MYTPHFTISPQVLEWIAAIEAIRAIVDQSRILPEQEIALRYRATIEAVHSSTTIEGNPLQKWQVESALAGKKVAQSAYAVAEVTNYKQALDWVSKRCTQPKALGLEDILKLHSLTMNQLLPEAKTGQLRPGAVYIVDIIDQAERVRYIGPDSTVVAQLLADLFDWLDKKAAQLHPVLAASILHYEFVSIHPFSDGNGRVARLLTMLYLSLRAYDFKNVLVLDSYYLEHRLAYYSALNQAKTYQQQRAADLTPWIEYFVKGFFTVATALRKDVSVAQLPQDGRSTVRLTPDEMTILDFTKQLGVIDLEEALDILQVPKRTAQRRLSELIKKKLLRKQGSGKATRYVLATKKRK